MTDRLLTIVIPTHRRPVSLEACLDSVLQQVAGRATVEIVVVENGALEGVRELVQARGSNAGGLRWIHEPRLGVSRARNAGWQVARGRYVAFLDDDVVLRSEWLQAFEELIARHPCAVAFGGPARAVALGVDPELLETYAFDLGDEEFAIDPDRHWLAGMNMVVRRDRLEAVGGFRPDLGWVGNGRCGGEEPALLRALAPGGAPIVYGPQLVVDHRVDGDRVTRGTVLQRQFSKARASVHIAPDRTRIETICLSFLETIRAILEVAQGTLRGEFRPWIRSLDAGCRFAGVVVGWVETRPQLIRDRGRRTEASR